MSLPRLLVYLLAQTATLQALTIEELAQFTTNRSIIEKNTKQGGYVSMDEITTSHPTLYNSARAKKVYVLRLGYLLSCGYTSSKRVHLHDKIYNSARRSLFVCLSEKIFHWEVKVNLFGTVFQ